MRWLLAIFLASFYTTLAIPPSIPVEPLKRGYTASQCLAWVTYSESRGEPLRGSRAVLDVIYTRMQARHMTVCEVVMQKGQFSGYREGRKLVTNEDMLTRLREASRIEPVARGCMYFHAISVRPLWAKKMKKCIAIGHHVFYKEKSK